MTAEWRSLAPASTPGRYAAWTRRLNEAALCKHLRKWPIFVLLATAVIVPALFWQRVWFGAYLSDEEIRRHLARPGEPREVQHACEQISRRMQRDPQRARQFYDLLVSLADHPNQDIRCVVAWCMGEDDTRHPPFHQALLGLAKDEAPRVRYNAALALVRFDAPAARGVLCEMLMPCTVSAQWEGQSAEGTVVDILNENDPVRPLRQLVLVETGDDEPKAILAPLGGRIGEAKAGLGDRIRKGEPVCTIEPDFQQVYEALRALTLAGQPEDLQHIQRYFDPQRRFSSSQQASLQTQARLAADAIRRREAHKRRQ